MAKNTAGEARLRRSLFKGKKSVILETKMPNSDEWGIDLVCNVQQGENGVEVIPVTITTEINHLADLGYKIVPCHYGHEW